MNKEIKICGTRSVMDLHASIEAGADAIGIICDRQHISQNTVDLYRAEWIIHCTPPEVTSVLVPRLTDPEALVKVAGWLKPDRVQLGENEDPRLAEALSGMDDRPQIAQVFHIGDQTTPDVMGDFLDHIDYAHFDTYSPDRPGGTGQTHDWERSKEMVCAAHEAGKLALLAGGLTAGNVQEAIRITEPDGVDVESYVKTPFRTHDQGLVRDFVESARAGFAVMEMVG